MLLVEQDSSPFSSDGDFHILSGGGEESILLAEVYTDLTSIYFKCELNISDIEACLKLVQKHLPQFCEHYNTKENQAQSISKLAEA